MTRAAGRVAPRALAAGGALDLDIRGTATHTYTVTLSDDISSIAGNLGVSKSSSTIVGHDHTVTFN